jgi:hypothetical protein
VAAALVIGVVAGIVGSALWEYFARPGLNSLWRVVLTVATLGSDAARDAAYASAAMDPTSVPSLLLVYMIIAGVVGAVGFLAGALTGKAARRRWKRNQAVESSESTADDALEAASSIPEPRWLGPLGFVSGAGILALVIMALVSVLMVNQSVVIWRTFNNHVARCAPCLTDDEEEALRAQFARVETRSEYLELEATLKLVASENGLVLKDVPLW